MKTIDVDTEPAAFPFSISMHDLQPALPKKN